MSFKITGAVWDMDLPHNEAWVLMAMADHADHSGRNVKPGIKLLAYKTGLSPRSVQRMMMRLRDRGILVMTQNREREHLPNVYRIDVHAAPQKAPFVLSVDDEDSEDVDAPPPRQVGVGVKGGMHPPHVRLASAPPRQSSDVGPTSEPCRGTHDRAVSSKPSVEPSLNHQVGTDVPTVSLGAHTRIAHASAGDPAPELPGLVESPAPEPAIESQPEPSPKPAKKPRRQKAGIAPETREAFEVGWQGYPSRGDSSNPKGEALEQYAARVAEGESVEDLNRASRNYGLAMKAVAGRSPGREGHGTALVMQAKRFFGASGVWRDYLDWKPSDTPAPERGKGGQRGGVYAHKRPALDPEDPNFWPEDRRASLLAAPPSPPRTNGFILDPEDPAFWANRG